MNNVTYKDFREIEKAKPDTIGIAENIYSIYANRTLYINTAYKGAEIERISYNRQTKEFKKLHE